MESSNQISRPASPLRTAEPGGKRPLPRGVVGLSATERGPGMAGREAAANGALIVGEGIEVKGEIASCRSLTVEGRVEASLDAESLEVRKGGHFTGTAEVDTAQIAGVVEGTLTVRGQLTVGAGGRVSGTVRYARIAIEAGGEIAGDIDVGGETEARTPKATLTGTGA